MKKTPTEGRLALVPRKAYSPPTLVVYGDLNRITQTVGNTGAADGGMAPNQKTAV